MMWMEPETVASYALNRLRDSSVFCVPHPAFRLVLALGAFPFLSRDMARTLCRWMRAYDIVAGRLGCRRSPIRKRLLRQTAALE